MSLVSSVALFGLPAIYAIVWIVLLVRARRAGLLVSLVMCVATFAAGYWAIGQSRASTAGIGFLFLPNAAALTGGLALLSGRLRRDSGSARRAAGWLCLAASVGLAGWIGVGGIQERAKNDDRDRWQAERLRAIEANRITIARIVHEHAGNESASLDAEIEQHRTDPTFLIPALETSFVSEEELDRLASDNDLTVVSWVSRNPRTRSDTLERIYRTSSYPTYFFQALAEHRNTPRDILDAIAASGDVFVLRHLLGNPSLDCALLRKTAARLSPADRNDARSSDATIASLETRLCAAKR